MNEPSAYEPPDGATPWPRHDKPLRIGVGRCWDGKGVRIRVYDAPHWVGALFNHMRSAGLSYSGLYSQNGVDERYDETSFNLRKKGPYVLWWPRAKWRCLLVRHHWPYWPEGRPVVFGMCGRCAPWPCCGSIELEHAEQCSAEMRVKAGVE